MANTNDNEEYCSPLYDFKRADMMENLDGENLSNDKANDYIRELLSERVALDHKYPHVDRLIELEIMATKQTGRPYRDTRYVDVYREKQIRVVVKVLVPVKEHPKFNFVGKLLGPKGNSMRRLQEDTMCKMAILGRGSMKEKKREDDLRTSLDPKYAHLNDDLHVEISAIGPPAEAHARVAYALAEVRKYLIPDSNDNIRQEQLREILSGEGGAEVAAKIKEKQKIPQYSRNQATSSSRSVMPAKTKILSILDRARVAMEQCEYHNGYEEEYQAPPPPTHQQHHHPHQHVQQHYEPTYAYSAPVNRRYEVPSTEYSHPREYSSHPHYREAPSYPAEPPRSNSSWKHSASSHFKSSSAPRSESSSHRQSSRPSEIVRYRTSPYPRTTPHSSSSSSYKNSKYSLRNI